jgi:hypothetical protein
MFSILSFMFTLILYDYVIGGIPSNIIIGVVNHNNCIAQYPNTNSTSCLFIDKIIDRNMIQLVPYEYPDEAIKDTVNGQLTGMIVLPQNVTESICNWMDFNTDTTVDVYLDQTDYHSTYTIKFLFLESLKAFAKDLNMKVDAYEIVPLYGTIQGDFKRNIFLHIAFL